jgi:hypothetical protein
VGSPFSTSSTHRVTSEEWAIPPPLVTLVVLLMKRIGSSSSTFSTRRVISEEWIVPPPLVAPVVFLLKSGQFLLH